MKLRGDRGARPVRLPRHQPAVGRLDIRENFLLGAARAGARHAPLRQEIITINSLIIVMKILKIIANLLLIQ